MHYSIVAFSYFGRDSLLKVYPNLRLECTSTTNMIQAITSTNKGGSDLDFLVSAVKLFHGRT